MSQTTRNFRLKKCVATFLIGTFLFINMPVGALEIGFKILVSKIQDSKVVDKLYLSEGNYKIGDVIDNLWISKLSAAVNNNGNMLYGDTTNPGTLKSILFTNPGTFGAENAGDATSASNIVHMVAKTSPTRDEIMVGHLKVDGRLDILTCTGSTGCDAAAEHTPQWNNPGTTATQDCDSAPTIGTCVQSFDLAYEALSGEAMVVYTDTTAATVYFALWDGSAWSPNATPGTPGVSNDILTNSGGPTCAGTIRWVRVIPSGDNLADERSNRIILLVADSNNDLCGFYWDGSAWDAGTTLFANLTNCDRARCFDGNWQGERTFVVSYTTAAASEIRYQVYTVGTGWGSDTQAYTLASAGEWVMSAADPTSSRIYVTTASSGNDTRGAVWRADDATDGWTVCASGGCPDTAIETVAGMQASGVFERFNGEAFHAFNNAGTTNTQTYMTYTPTSTWGAATTLGLTSTDDLQSILAVAAPNSDDVFIIATDVDCDMDARMWNGSALQTISSNFELLASHTNNLCANAAPVEGMGNGYSYGFAWRMYSPWARNWRFYNGTDTTNTPTTALANENTTATSFDGVSGTARLRYSVIELTSGSSQTDARKKLQYTTGTPDSSLTTWTDVDDVAGAGIWRYRDCNSGDANICNDNIALSGTVLSGTPTAGWWVQDKDAAGGTVMDHNAGQLRELEFSIEANGAAANTTYYFRMYDVDQDFPVYREQDTDGSNDCATAACTYPSITTAAPSNSAPTVATNAATGITAISAVLNGNISNTGGVDPTDRGFAWGTNSTLSGGDTSTTTESGTFSTGTFTNNVGALVSGRTYYFRAYATNTEGTGYGSITSFVAGTSNTPSRKMRLFEGASFKFTEGKINLYQQ